MLEDASRHTAQDDVVWPSASDDGTGSDGAVLANLTRTDERHLTAYPAIVADLDWVCTLEACDALLDLDRVRRRVDLVILSAGTRHVFSQKKLTWTLGANMTRWPIVTCAQSSIFRTLFVSESYDTLFRGLTWQLKLQ